MVNVHVTLQSLSCRLPLVGLAIGIGRHFCGRAEMVKSANVVRWCVLWLKRCAPEPTPKWQQVSNSPKHLVHVAANAAALVQHTPCGTALQFDSAGSFPGVTLFLVGVPAFQLALGFNQPHEIASG